MEQTLQPCDWYEHDASGKYVVDVFGRTNKGQVACVRINGFKPYFYVKCDKKPSVGNVTEVEKYDVFAGFSDLRKTKVWKVVCDTKAKCMEATKAVSGILYESNLPAFMRLFHERDIGPASPIRFKGSRFSIPCARTEDEAEEPKPLYNIDEFYNCDVKEVFPAPDVNIPLKVACYDLEMYSASGMFPQALKDDPIVQMGVSYRWSDKMLDPIRKVVYVVGDVDKSDEEDVEFVGCRDEEDMLFRFAHEIRTQNPDIMCGYNTFGFDDAYIEDRCKRLCILDEVDFSRYQSKTKVGDAWKVKFSETKKFELASGKCD